LLLTELTAHRSHGGVPNAARCFPQVQYGRKTDKGKCGIQSSLATTSCGQGSSRNPWPGADLFSLTASTLADATLLLATFCSSLMMAMLPFLM
jgi:hypothetical protein